MDTSPDESRWNTKETNKRYNEDFKRTVVDLYHSDYSVNELSSEYDQAAAMAKVLGCSFIPTLLCKRAIKQRGIVQPTLPYFNSKSTPLLLNASICAPVKGTIYYHVSLVRSLRSFNPHSFVRSGMSSPLLIFRYF